MTCAVLRRVAMTGLRSLERRSPPSSGPTTRMRPVTGQPCRHRRYRSLHRAADLRVVGCTACARRSPAGGCRAEGERCGFGASSRNGGFCDGSLTHGFLNGLSHCSTRSTRSNDSGSKTWQGCWTPSIASASTPATGPDEITFAVAEWQCADLDDMAEICRRQDLVSSSRSVQSIVSSTRPPISRFVDVSIALLDPARLVWASPAVERLGGVIHDDIELNR